MILLPSSNSLSFSLLWRLEYRSLVHFWIAFHGMIAMMLHKLLICTFFCIIHNSGKIAAQCGHAAVGCYKRSRKQCPSALSAWEKTGCAKIAVKCPSEEEIVSIIEQAHKKGIPMCLVEDAGRTQIAAGSRTVLGLGPAPVREFEGVTSHLKLM